MGTDNWIRIQLKRTFTVLRSIGGVILTVAIILADAVKSAYGGGASSSVYPTVLLPSSRDTSTSEVASSEKALSTKRKRPHRKRKY